MTRNISLALFICFLGVPCWAAGDVYIPIDHGSTIMLFVGFGYLVRSILEALEFLMKVLRKRSKTAPRWIGFCLFAVTAMLILSGAMLGGLYIAKVVFAAA